MFVLRTERLVLRDFQPDDFENFYSPMLDPESARYYSEQELDRSFMGEIFAKILRQTTSVDRTSYQLAICLPDGEYVGTVGVRMENIESQQASYGCATGRKFWRQGYAYEASRRMFDYGFTSLPIHRIFAETNCENRNARRLAERLGMRLEGELRESKFFNNRWWSTCIYGVLRSEWEAETQK